MDRKTKKEISRAITASIMPIVEAVETDKRTKEEKELLVFFNGKIENKNTRIKNISIINELLGKKVVVNYFDGEHYFVRKFNYDKIMKEVQAKKERDLKKRSIVLENYCNLVTKFEHIINSANNKSNKRYLEIAKILKDNYQEIDEMNRKEIFSVQDITIMERLDKLVNSLAAELNIELDSNKILAEASVRELLSKDCLSIKEENFISAATNYLRDKNKLTDKEKEDKKFTNLSFDTKVKISYYEVLFQKLADYTLKVSREKIEGEMLNLNKFFIENAQKQKRKEQALIEKVLNDEELEKNEYVDLAFMKIDYQETDIETLMKSYILEEIREKIEVLKKVSKKEGENYLYESKIIILQYWEKLINILKNGNVSDLESFIEDISNIEVKNIKKYGENYAINNYNQDNDDFDYSQYIAMFDKIIEYIEKYCENGSYLKDSLLERVKRDKTSFQNDQTLLFISIEFKKFAAVKEGNSYDYERVVAAYYDSFSESATSEMISETNKILRNIVDLQIAEFEENISSKLREEIKKDKLSVPKKYFK